MTGPETVRFLGREADIRGGAVWNDPRQDKLWLYNLHYFDDLNARGAENRREWHRGLIERWIAQNPPGTGNGWEPYPTSLRIVNWVKWALRGSKLSPAAVHSLAVQARWLSHRVERHLGGNHLIANAKGLAFAGRFFRGEEADAWRDSADGILRRELREQVLDDGGHLERSPMYHLLVLEDVLDLINLERAFGKRPPDSWLEVARRMLYWSSVMRHPDGEIPFFNDAAFGIAGSPGEIDAYAGRLEIPLPPPPDRLAHLESSGYVRAALGPAVLFADVAPVGPDHLPAHAHADTLSFELSVRGSRVIVNGGTSVYGTGRERNRQRGTAAHSTVTVDGLNSSEVWASFRVARRAKPQSVQVDWKDSGEVIIEGCHDGYTRLRGRPMHCRRWRLIPTGLAVEDRVVGRGEHEILATFPLAPPLIPERGPDGEVRLRFDGEIRACVSARPPPEIHFERTTWHPRFGVAEPSWELRRTASAALLPQVWETRISW